MIARESLDTRLNRMSRTLGVGEKPHRTAGQASRSAWNQNGRDGKLYKNRRALLEALAIFEADLEAQTAKQSPARVNTLKRIAVTKTVLATVNRHIAALEGNAS